jgi:hypothetical protein
MSKSNTLEIGVLKLVFQNINLANIGDATGLQASSTAGNLYIALYTSNPTDADSGTEANYTSYARVAVGRSATNFSVSAGATDADPSEASNAIVITFPTATAGSNTITHFGIHTDASTGNLVYYGSLNSSIVVSTGKTPKFNIGELIIKEQ